MELLSGRTLKIVCITADYAKVKEFHRYLGSLFGVEKPNFKSFENKKAHYLVRFLGQRKTLTDIILRMHPSSMGISVKKLGPDSIVLHVD